MQFCSTPTQNGRRFFTVLTKKQTKWVCGHHSPRQNCKISRLVLLQQLHSSTVNVWRQLIASSTLDPRSLLQVTRHVILFAVLDSPFVTWASWTVYGVIANLACPLSCAFTTTVFWRCCCTGPRRGQSWKLTGWSFNPSICAVSGVYCGSVCLTSSPTLMFLHQQV